MEVVYPDESTNGNAISALYPILIKSLALLLHSTFRYSLYVRSSTLLISSWCTFTFSGVRAKFHYLIIILISRMI